MTKITKRLYTRNDWGELVPIRKVLSTKTTLFGKKKYLVAYDREHRLDQFSTIIKTIDTCWVTNTYTL